MGYKIAPTRRVGLLIPSSNTVMEVDFYRRLPAHVTVHTARMLMERTTAEGEAEMLDSYALPAARALGTVMPDVVVFGCTSAGALRGDEYDRWLCDSIADVTGARVVSVIKAVQQTIGRLGAKSVAVVTPYIDELNARIRSSLEDATAATVVATHGMGIVENEKIARVTPEEITQFASGHLTGVDVDLVFVSCTNFRAIDVIPELQRKLRVPVCTSNQAAFDAVSDLLGLDIGSVPSVA